MVEMTKRGSQGLVLQDLTAHARPHNVQITRQITSLWSLIKARVIAGPT